MLNASEIDCTVFGSMGSNLYILAYVTQQWVAEALIEANPTAECPLDDIAMFPGVVDISACKIINGKIMRVV